ncbi:uncharacterized protein A4U43_C05F4440 [Asparagus officinalis]|uniref:RecA family profile 1 domain-containing protein n=1 Tax=Asparagus officinalis TaxID=4686 RepID=A0A5P1ETI4_ASPOF|nr:DNA repair protein RAD51 homolog 2 isoform X2 [Asparagus officinalis]ONK67851.1 uncharacterized protein A4U43_C05F4440 [Asparagus officinalis]
MSNKLISEMNLPQSIANIFAARNILTAKDALSLPEIDLMSLLDVGLKEVNLAIARISEVACPPYQTAFSLMEDRVRKEAFGGHLSTSLVGLDNVLCGGIPFGVLTELVGPSGIGKTQMAGRIVVLRPTSLSEFTESLHQMKLKLLQHEVKLLVIDSMAALALLTGENERSMGTSRQSSLRLPLPFLKSLAEFSRIPIVVTNQVRSQSGDGSFHYSFQGQNSDFRISERLESHLTAALGIQWAHAVTIRLVFEAHSGQRFIKVAKSPISPPLAFPFIVSSSGISLLSDDGIEIMGQEISTIHCLGQNILDM